MKKIVFGIACFLSLQATAQSVDSYVFKVETGKTYTPLTSGTNLTSSIVWDEDNFKFPIGFTADVGGKSITDFAFSSGWGFAVGSDTEGVVNTFCAISGVDIADRGLLTGIPKSPLRYQLTGTAPNRIFKFEAFNLGFFNESDKYGTMNDSANVQVWLYETSNIVEVRYGPSSITHPSDSLFDLGASPLVGYGKGLDFDNLVMDKLYMLKGNPSAPTVDSITSIMSPIPVMTAFPANGTVYRFVPKAVASSVTHKVLASSINVYPTVCQDVINIEISPNIAHSSAAILSSSGQLIQTLELSQGLNTVALSQLPLGMYTVLIQSDQGKASYKFVKQ